MKRFSEQTLFELRMASLLPQNIVALLEAKRGQSFGRLPHDDKVVVVSAVVEGTIDHSGACRLTGQHPADVTKQLRRLCRDGYLVAEGRTRGTFYRPLDTSNDERGAFYGFDPVDPPASTALVDAPAGLPVSSAGLSVNPTGLPVSSRGLPVNPAALPVSSSVVDKLRTKIALRHPQGLPGKLPRPDMAALILTLLDGDFVAPQDLASALDRSPVFLRASYLKPLLLQKLIEARFPDTPSHPQQAYRKRQ